MRVFSNMHSYMTISNIRVVYQSNQVIKTTTDSERLVFNQSKMCAVFSSFNEIIKTN